MSSRSAFATMLRRVVLLALVWALVASSVGFAAGSARRTPPTTPTHTGRHPRLVSISLSPDSAALMPGQTVRFAATGHYSDGSNKDVTWWARWRSSDTSVVTLSRWHRGLATAIAEGTATISATFRRVRGSASVTVGGPTATLESIEITPEGSTIAEGGTVQYAARGQYSDATSRDITATVSWSSSDADIATIDATGLATGLRFGTATIGAAQDGVSDSADLTVSPRIDSIEITPRDPSISMGDDVQFGVLAHFTDGSSSDASPNVVWSSSDASVATIDAAGLATGLAEGTTTITASCDIEEVCSSQQDSTMLQVSPLEPPPPTDGSSQDLIEQDLTDGIIDYPTSLEYRTWALFRDLRLPSRYADAPSVGEDQALFRELDAVFDILPEEVQVATKPYLVPPNDPESAFGPTSDSGELTQHGGLSASAATDPTSTTRCQAPAFWRSMDWTPDGGGPNDGFRVLACAGSDAEASDILGPVVAAASSLWGPMTEPGPDGMGKPIPDNVKGFVFGNGKIDIFIVYTNDCIGEGCPLAGPNGRWRLGVERKLEATCHAEGHPSQGCSGYLVLNASEVCPASAQCPADAAAHLKGVLAHEFFHVLEDAHNAQAFVEERLRIGETVYFENSWYYEASATWAGWHYGQDPDAYEYFESFQDNDRSLLHFGDLHEYASWVWPLLMQVELGASSIAESWQKAESAIGLEGIDDAVDDTFSFAGHFRDLSVRNLEPFEYFDGGGVGLEGDIWQTDVDDFPRTPHLLRDVSRIDLGEQFVLGVDVAVLAAEDDWFDFAPNVRQVTIDIGSLTNAPNADLDIVGLLAPDALGRSTWDRIRVSGTKVTFCRDSADQDFDLIYVALSNHGRARSLLGPPDPDAALTGGYTIKAKDHCDVPIAYEGTFHSTHDTGSIGIWTKEGTVRFEAIDGLRCDVPWIEYCYEAVSAEITLTVSEYVLPGTPTCTVRPHGPIHFRLPDDDPPIDGFLGIVDQSQDPKDDVYEVGLSSAGHLPSIQATETCDNGETWEVGIWPGNNWLLAPGVYGRTGWLLTGSYHAASSSPQFGDATYDEEWEFTPIFDEA